MQFAPRSSGLGTAVLLFTLFGLLGLLARPPDARAEEPVVRVTAPKPKPEGKKHALYLELFGRGGIWGAGYDYAVLPRLSLGALASFMIHDGEEVTTVTPYLTWYPLGAYRHRLFLSGGPQLVHLRTPSPVPEWDGMSETGVGAQVAAGWEYRRGVLVRVFGMATAGKGGTAPWLGVSLGWTL